MLNVNYHEVMLAAIVVGLILLLIPGVRALLRHGEKETGVKVTHA